MLSLNNTIVQSTVDVFSKNFLKEFAKSNNYSMAEVSGAIIRQFIFKYSRGCDDYKELKFFVATNK